MTPIRVRQSAIPPRDLLELFAASGETERFYWERPESGEAILALGAVDRIESSGPSRFGEAASRVREIRALLRKEGDAPSWAGPLLVGGFAFDSVVPSSERWAGFPPAELVLPERLLIRRGWGDVVLLRRGRNLLLRRGRALRGTPLVGSRGVG